MIERPRLLSVAEAASALKASEAYIRRLLARERLYGIKIGFVWAIYAADVEAFKRMRRPPGRPRKLAVSLADTESAAEAAGEMAGERASAGTHRLLRKRGRKRR